MLLVELQFLHVFLSRIAQTSGGTLGTVMLLLKHQEEQ